MFQKICLLEVHKSLHSKVSKKSTHSLKQNHNNEKKKKSIILSI